MKRHCEDCKRKIPETEWANVYEGDSKMRCNECWRRFSILKRLDLHEHRLDALESPGRGVINCAYCGYTRERTANVEQEMDRINERLHTLENPPDSKPSQPAPDDLAELIAGHHMIHIQAVTATHYIINMNDATRLATAIREAGYRKDDRTVHDIIKELESEIAHLECELRGARVEAYDVIRRLERELAEAREQLTKAHARMAAAKNQLSQFNGEFLGAINIGRYSMIVIDRGEDDARS